LQEFATPAECQAILGVARTRPAERLKLMDREKSTEERVVRKYDENRITHRVDMGEQQTLLDTLVLRAIRTQIEPGLGVRFDWFEEPQLLQYGPGGLYHHHADSENFDAATDRWERAQDRDTSLLIYLDEDYEGGELHFPNFDFTLRPKPGTLVYFPSDHRYLHAAREVTAGQRHAIVSWLAQTGVDKLRPPPDDAIML
jgi:predicted 2-oxoglutarate/Fe(II)-dependent dioxygenase YbiX